MSYRDPYAQQQERYSQSYADGPEYDPYNNSRPPHQTYDQGLAGYDSEPQTRTDGYTDDPTFVPPVNAPYPSAGRTKESSGFERGEFVPPTGRRARDVRNWRYGNQGALWTKGSRGSCIGRFCCCTLLIAIFLIVSIILPLVLWVRPPNITIGDVQVPTSTSAVQLSTDSLDINLGVNISVNNPNYFAVSFSSIQAKFFYPINNTLVGNGTENDITFHANSQKNFTFPFTIGINTTESSSAAILDDLATKCGFIGSSPSDITVNYQITLNLKIAASTISPVISNSLSFACPITESDIEGLIPGIGGAV